MQNFYYQYIKLEYEQKTVALNLARISSILFVAFSVVPLFLCNIGIISENLRNVVWIILLVLYILSLLFFLIFAFIEYKDSEWIKSEWKKQFKLSIIDENKDSRYKKLYSIDPYARYFQPKIDRKSLKEDCDYIERVNLKS